MNYSMVMYIIGWILNFEAAFMLPSCLVAVIYQEKCGISFLITMAAALVIGIPLTVRKPKNKDFHSREGFASVALGWIVLSIVGAVPFVISGVIPNPVEALFEAVSGFTTTGSSVLTNVEVVPRCILFWRSFTHWIGGMGVLVFIMAILPLSGGKNINLMRAESPGPSVTKMTSKIKSTAKVLYQIYIVMTIIQIILLLIGKMPLFDALTITFGTAGTGGFGIKNDSLAGYSPYLQYVVTTFMILFGVNFNFYFLLLLKKPIEALKSEEVRWYFGIIAAAVLVIFLYIRSSYPTAEEAFRHSAFQVGSIITTTGYATTDFNLWAQVPRHSGHADVCRGMCGKYRRRNQGIPYSDSRKDHQKRTEPACTSYRSQETSDGRTADFTRSTQGCKCLYDYLYSDFCVFGTAGWN